MGWYVPFEKLGQQQSAIIQEITRGIDARNHFINGFAGSGKSALLTHVLELIAADRIGSRLVFLSYTHALVGMTKTALLGSGLDEATMKRIEFSTVHSFMYGDREADYVFVDEVQDLQADWLDKIKRKSRHVVLAGDFVQSIYDETASYNDILQVFDPMVHELREVFRLTPSLKRVAVSIYPAADNIVEADPVKVGDADIRDVEFDTLEEEVEWVLSEAWTVRAGAGSPSALLFHHHHDLRLFYEAVFRVRSINLPSEHPRDLTERYINMNDAMQAAGIPLSYYGNKVGTLIHGEKGPHVYLMTIHSAKGLDFKNVFLPGLNRGPKSALSPSEPFKRSVSFVGVTRSFENLFLSHSQGAMETPFDNLPEDVLKRWKPRRPTNVDDELFF